jgi:hypothetical protein
MVGPREGTGRRRYTRADVVRLRKRHRGYQLTLAMEVLLVLCLPLAELWPGLLSLMLVLLRKVQGLVRKPFVTVSGVMGPAVHGAVGVSAAGLQPRSIPATWLPT